MRLKVLLTAAMLIASPAMAQQQPPAPPEASPSERVQSPAKETSPVDTLPVSIERIRAVLGKPPPMLRPPELKADFTVHIEARRPLQDIFDVPPWATDPLGQSRLCPPRQGALPSAQCGIPPGFSVDPGSLIQSLKRAYHERAARDEVKRAIADYCAAQPNAGAGIQICAAATAVR